LLDRPRGNRIWLIRLFIVSSLAGLVPVSGLLAQSSEETRNIVADFVWSEEFASGSRILHSRYSDGAWSKPESVVENVGLNILPAVAAAGPNDMVVVWSTVRPSGVSLRYSRYTRDTSPDGKWSKDALLTEKYAVNLAPVLLAVNGGYQAFWSAHEGSDDDILSSRFTAGGWTEPVQIHGNNIEVDTLPEAGFDLNQRIWVRWESIGSESAEKRLQTFETEESLESPNPGETLDLDQLEKLEGEKNEFMPPVFFRSKSRATMYFHGITTHPIKLFPGNLLP